MHQSLKRIVDRTESLFPCVEKRTSVHITPTDCYVRQISSESTERSGSPFRDKLWGVNHDAARLLSLCDGSLRIADLPKALGISADPETVARLCGFLDEAQGRGEIVLTDCATTPRNPRVTGSSEFYVPIHITVEVSSRCNLACSYCYNDFEDSRQPDMSVEELSRILDEWADLGLGSVEVSGGEPFLHPQIGEILDYCFSKFRSVALLTNGTLIDRHAADELAQWTDRLLVGISLDGPDAQTHDSVSAPGAFVKASRAIRLLADRGVFVRAAMTALPTTIFRTEETLLMAKGLGARYFSYSPVTPFGGGKELAWKWNGLDPHEVAEMEADLARKYAGFLTVLDENQRKAGSENCGAGHKNVILSPHAKLRTCIVLPEGDSFADLRSETLEEALRKPILEHMRNLETPRVADCEGCRYEGYCAGCVVRPLAALAREGRLCRWAHANSAQELLGACESLEYDEREPLFT